MERPDRTDKSKAETRDETDPRGRTVSRTIMGCVEIGGVHDQMIYILCRLALPFNPRLSGRETLCASGYRGDTSTPPDPQNDPPFAIVHPLIRQDCFRTTTIKQYGRSKSGNTLDPVLDRGTKGTRTCAAVEAFTTETKGF
jgi:hypothetical protein